MIPIGESYRPAGPISVRSVMTTLILGTVTAILSALAIWLWEVSPLPTLVIVTSLVHGLLIGTVMAFMVGRLRMRNPGLVAMIGLACGTSSVVLVHYGHYYQIVNTVNDALRAEVAEDTTSPPEAKAKLLASLDENPTWPADQILVDKTGHGGLLGSLLIRNEQGVTIRHLKATGWFLWLLWGGEAAFVAWMAMALPLARASGPFCEDCGLWCQEKTSPFLYGEATSGQLVDAIRTDDAVKIAEAGASTLASDAPRSVALLTHRCPNCDLAFASLTRLVAKGKETRKVIVLKAVCVSPPTADVILNVPVPPALDEERLVPEGEAVQVKDPASPSQEE